MADACKRDYKTQICQFINFQRGMSVTRTGTFKVRVISVFSSYMKPIYSFKKGNNYHRHWDIQSTDDQQILSLRGADLLIYKEKLLSKRPDTQSPHGQHFSPSPSPFVESWIVIRRLLHEHEVWSEWMSKEMGWDSLLTSLHQYGQTTFAIQMSALCLSNAACLQNGHCQRGIMLPGLPSAASLFRPSSFLRCTPPFKQMAEFHIPEVIFS